MLVTSKSLDDEYWHSAKQMNVTSARQRTKIDWSIVEFYVRIGTCRISSPFPDVPSRAPSRILPDFVGWLVVL